MSNNATRNEGIRLVLDLTEEEVAVVLLALRTAEAFGPENEKGHVAHALAKLRTALVRLGRDQSST